MRSIAGKMRKEFRYKIYKTSAVARWNAILDGVVGGITPEEVKNYLNLRLYVAEHNHRHHSEIAALKNDYQFACKLCAIKPKKTSAKAQKAGNNSIAA